MGVKYDRVPKSRRNILAPPGAAERVCITETHS